MESFTHEKLTISYRKPSMNQIVNAIAEKEVRSAVFWSCELGRRYLEELQVKKDPDLALLRSEASDEDRLVFAEMSSWGIQDTMRLIEAENPERFLLNNYRAVRALRDKLFGDGSSETPESQEVAGVEAEPERT